MPATEGEWRLEVGFPVFALAALPAREARKDPLFIVAGGGGKLNTGVPNSILVIKEADRAILGTTATGEGVVRALAAHPTVRATMMARPLCAWLTCRPALTRRKMCSRALSRPTASCTA